MADLVTPPLRSSSKSFNVGSPASSVAGEHPPVMVLYHPSMETLARSLVDVTKTRMLSLSNVNS